MLFLNFMLFKKFRLAMNKKKNMLNHSPSSQISTVNANSNNESNNQKQTKINNANKNLNLMILCQCLNSTFERVPVFIVFIFKNTNLFEPKLLFFLFKIARITIQLAYLFKFFIFFFNKRFREKLSTILFKFCKRV